MINGMRRKVNTFFHVFKQSLFPKPGYYKKIPKSSFNFSLKYFISLILILNFLLVFFIIIQYHPQRINRNLNSLIISLKTFPKDLVINIRKDRLFTSYDHPYLFWSKVNGKLKLLLVIDETANAAKINQYNSYVLITNNKAVFKTDNQPANNFYVVPLTRFGDQTLNINSVKKIIQTLINFQSLLIFIYPAIVIMLLIILPVSSFLTTLFYLSIISLIVYIIFKVYFHKKIHYKKTFQISLHAVTFPLILDYFLIAFKPSIGLNIKLKPIIPPSVTFVILLAIFVFTAVYEAYQNDKNHQPHHFHPQKNHHR